MKLCRLLTTIALLPLGCVQGGPQQAPPSSAAARPAVPSAPASAPPSAENAAPAPRERIRLNVPAGTLLPMEIRTPVSTATSREGDPVLAVLTEDVPLQGFKLDKGAEVRGRVLTAVSAKRVKGRAHLVIGFDAVMVKAEKLSIATQSIDSLAASTSGKDKKIIAGAVLIMKGDEVEIPRGARLTITVTK